jgi:hypothetical protein
VEAAEALLREDEAKQAAARLLRDVQAAAEEAARQEAYERTRPEREAETAQVKERLREAQIAAGSKNLDLRNVLVSK